MVREGWNEKMRGEKEKVVEGEGLEEKGGESEVKY